MPKAILLVLDGVGVGELPDARAYGDGGSNTLLHVAEAVGGLHLPVLASLGLGNILSIPGVEPIANPRAGFGRMAEASAGKDSTTGHWELAGLINPAPFPTYPKGFPPDLVERFKAATGCANVLGNKAASGTAIIQEVGQKHCVTRAPIVYTSADSVFQIAAHEDVIPPAELYEICLKTRREVCVGQHAVGRVIARPFTGVNGAFVRTADRRDFALEPPKPTLLDVLASRRVEVISIGKVDDLFSGRGITTASHTSSNDVGIEQIVQFARKMKSGLIFANLVDFDTLYGHRNDPAGFARAMVQFDQRLEEIIDPLEPSDLLLITADHGNDPVTPSTDHSREYVPLLALRKAKPKGEDLGTRATFADVGRTLADFFEVPNSLSGQSFLSKLQ